MREKSPGKGESWQTEPRDPTILPVWRVSWQPEPTSRGSGFDFIKEVNTFPSIQCGLCVVHSIGFQDVKCHPRTELGKEWAKSLFRELQPTIEESGACLPNRLNSHTPFREQQGQLR